MTESFGSDPEKAAGNAYYKWKRRTEIGKKASEGKNKLKGALKMGAIKNMAEGTGNESGNQKPEKNSKKKKGKKKKGKENVDPGNKFQIVSFNLQYSNCEMQNTIAILIREFI